MLQNTIFMVTFLAVALFFALHGLMMLFMPNASNVFTDWWTKATGLGPQSDQERRGETRLAGLTITAMGIVFLVLPLRWWILNPNPSEVAPTRAAPAWALLLLGALMLGLGYFITKTAERTTREMFENIPQLTLVRPSTIRVWVWRQRIGGILIMFGSLIPLSLWVKSLRR